MPITSIRLSTRLTRLHPRPQSPFTSAPTPYLRRPSIRTYSSPASPSPSPSGEKNTETNAAIRRLRTDLGTALRANAKARLVVIRSLLAEVALAAKTPRVISTDAQLLAVVRKRVAAAEAAMQEFAAAGRADLAAREGEEMAVLEEYFEALGGGRLGDGVELEARIRGVLDEMRAGAGEGKVLMGEVMKRLLGPGGVLEGKADGKTVAAAVKRMCGGEVGVV